MGNDRKNGIAELAFMCFAAAAGFALGIIVSNSALQRNAVADASKLDKEAYRRICAELGFVTEASYKKFDIGDSLESALLPEFYKGGQFDTEDGARRAERIGLGSFTKPYLMVVAESPGCVFCLANRKALTRAAEGTGEYLDIVALDVAARDSQDVEFRQNIRKAQMEELGLDDDAAALPSRAAELAMLPEQTEFTARQLSLSGSPTIFIFDKDSRLIFRHDGSLAERLLPDGEGSPGNARAYDEFNEIVDRIRGAETDVK